MPISETALKTRHALFRILPWGILVGGLALTWLLVAQLQQREAQAEREELALRVDEIINSLEGRLKSNIQILRGAASLFTSSKEVSRDEFRRYVTGLRLSEYYPGIQAIGYVAMVPAGEKASHVAAIRAEGYPDYDITPPGDRDSYSSLIYTEPFDGQNIRAFGFDLLTEPVRFSAAVRARDQNQAVISSPLPLRQEADRDEQAGVVVFAPVYRNDVPLDTVEQRRAALRGWVCQALRIKDAVGEHLRSEYGELSKRLSLKIYSPANRPPDAAIFDSHPEKVATPDRSDAVRRIAVAGADWSVHLRPLPAYWSAEGAARSSRTVLYAGGFVSLVLAYAAFVLTRSHHRVSAALGQARLVNRLLAEHEESLHVSEQRHRLLADHASDVIWTMDRDGRLTYVSPSVERLRGFTVAEVLQQSVEEMLTPTSAAVARAGIQRAIEAVYARQVVPDMRIELEQSRRDGSTVWTEVTTSSIFDAEGRFVSFLGVSRDISERKRIEQELLDAKATAESASRIKSEFLANMSHEIRTPMNAILGLGHLALQADPTPRLRDYLTKITASAEGLLRLLNDLLDVAKIEARQITLEEATFSLPALLQRLTSLVAVEADRKSLRLCVTTDPQTPEHLRGDALRLEQVLLNLLGNAVKFTREGEVELAIRPMDTGPEQVKLQFAVKDTGIGMSREQIAGIFEPFAQAESSTTRKFGGTGLGLSICQRLVTMLGGEIRVQSELGRGSTFSFTTTFRRGNALDVPPEPIPDRAVVAAALRRRRLLVAEDQPINQQVVRELLEQVGVNVTIAGNGREAVAAVTASSDGFDAVLMDLQMPDMDGYEATRRIREQWPADRLPIIAMTAHAYDDERQRRLAAGMNEHLAKPVKPDRLYSCLVRWIRPLAGGTPPDAGGVSQRQGGELPAHLPGLNVADGIACLGGNTVLYRKLAVEFGRSMGTRGEDIRAALTAGDPEEGRRLAHALKGVAGSIAATRLQTIAAALEEDLGRGRTEDIERQLAALNEALAEARVSASVLADASLHGNEPGPLHDLDLTAAIPLLAALSPLLRQRNLAALDVMKRLEAVFAASVVAAEVAPLAEAVDRLDFSAAEAQADGLRRRLVRMTGNLSQNGTSDTQPYQRELS